MVETQVSLSARYITTASIMWVGRSEHQRLEKHCRALSRDGLSLEQWIGPRSLMTNTGRFRHRRTHLCTCTGPPNGPRRGFAESRTLTGRQSAPGWWGTLGPSGTDCGGGDRGPCWAGHGLDIHTYTDLYTHKPKPNHVFVRCWLGHSLALSPIHVGLVTLTPSLPSPKPASHGPSSFIEMMPEVVCQQSMFPPRPLCLWRLGRGEWPI